MLFARGYPVLGIKRVTPISGLHFVSLGEPSRILRRSVWLPSQNSDAQIPTSDFALRSKRAAGIVPFHLRRTLLARTAIPPQQHHPEARWLRCAIDAKAAVSTNILQTEFQCVVA